MVSHPRGEFWTVVQDCGKYLSSKSVYEYLILIVQTTRYRLDPWENMSPLILTPVCGVVTLNTKYEQIIQNQDFSGN